MLALLIARGAFAADDQESRWPRSIRDPNFTLCLSTPHIDELKDGTATIRCVYRLILTPQDVGAREPIWGVVTLAAQSRLDAAQHRVVLSGMKVAALSAATMDADDAPAASGWLAGALSGSALFIDDRELLALLPDHALPAPEAAGEGSLAEREAALVQSLAASAADADASTDRPCTDESFGDPYVGRGNWIHRLREDRWERWSPEHGWVDAHTALAQPAGAPWSMGSDTIELLRARAAATTAGMRRDPRTLEAARARRFEAQIRTASQTLGMHAPDSVSSPAPEPAAAPAPAPVPVPVPSTP